MKVKINNITIVLNDDRFNSSTAKNIIMQNFEPITKELYYISDNIRNVSVINNTKTNQLLYHVNFIDKEETDILEVTIERILKRFKNCKVKLLKYDRSIIKFEYKMNVFESAYFRG